jgi:hypothetical protein
LYGAGIFSGGFELTKRHLDQIPEAAAIMAAMVRMPPKPHEEMKLGKSKTKGKKKASRAPKPKTLGVS